MPTASASICSPPSPLRIVQVGDFGAIGDNIYRLHEPAAALARLPGVQVYEVHPLSRQRAGAALAADVLVLTMTLDVEVLRLIEQRRLLGKPTVCEVNDYLPDVQPWNPVHRSWSDPRGLRLFEQLIRRCDATQVTCEPLARRLAHWAQQLAVFPNQMASMPERRARPPAPPDAPVVVGWGGSLGHLHDLRHIAPALTAWLRRQPRALLEIMGDPSMAVLFEGVAPGQLQFRLGGPLADDLQWLQGLDIGLAPLLPTEYNRCRSDVKFLEYASCGVVPVVQRLEPYGAVRHGVTGWLFDSPDELVSQLDALVASPELRQRVADAAYEQVRGERMLDQHAHRRLDFYHAQLARMPRQRPDALPDLLARAGSRALQSLPGWQALAPNHWRLDLSAPAEHHRAAGVQALQEGALARACHEFAAAARLDPGDAHALSFLGHCLQQQGRPQRALARLQRSAPEPSG